jgi:hypothetical protein
MGGMYIPSTITSGFSDAVRVFEGFLPDYCVPGTYTTTLSGFTVVFSTPYSERTSQLIGRARCLDFTTSSVIPAKHVYVNSWDAS